MIRQILLRGMNGNGVAGGDQELVCPLGWKIHNLQFHLTAGAITAAQITNVNVILNNDTVQTYTGTIRDQLNQYYGLPAFNGGVIPFIIPFANIGQKDRIDYEQTVLNTGGKDPSTGKSIDSVRIQLTTAAAATTPTWTVYAEVEPATEEGPGWIERIKTFQADLVAAAEANVYLPFYGTPQYAMLKALHIYHATAVIAQGRILYGVETQERFNKLAAVNLQDHVSLLGVFGNRTNTGYWNYTYDMEHKGHNTPLDTTGLHSAEKDLAFGVTSNTNGAHTFVYSMRGVL